MSLFHDPIDMIRLHTCLTRMEATTEALISVYTRWPIDLARLEHLLAQFADAERTYHQLLSGYDA